MGSTIEVRIDSGLSRLMGSTLESTLLYSFYSTLLNLPLPLSTSLLHSGLVYTTLLYTLLSSTQVRIDSRGTFRGRIGLKLHEPTGRRCARRALRQVS